MKFLTLDFGGTFVKYCVMDEDTNMEDKGQVPAPLTSTEEWVKLVTDLYAKYKGKVDGVTLSIPGIIDPVNGIAHTGGAYGEVIQGKNIYELLKPYVDVPVCIENDANAAVLAEQWKGALQDVKDGFACIVGSGLGGGIILDGKLYRGPHGDSAEISMLMMKMGEYSYQSWSAMAASTTGLLVQVAMAKQMDLKDFEVTGAITGKETSDKKKIGGKEVIQWVEDGDEVTTAVYKQWIKNLGNVLYNIKMILDPEKIVVGGGISKNPKVIADLKEEWESINAYLAHYSIPTAELDACKYTSDANMVGAVYSWLLLYEN